VIAVAVGCYSPAVRDGVPCPSGVCPSRQICDPVTVTCVREPGAVDAGSDDGTDADLDASTDADSSCPAGYTLQGTSCVDVNECAAATNACSNDATCANQPGSFTCTCNAGFTGSGQTCARVCSSVLIYDDCTGPTDADCAAIPQALFADNAALGLGMTVKYGGVGNEPAFRTLFDAGSFDVLIIEVSLADIDAATASRIATWVSGGGKAIISFWDLDNATTGMTIRTAAQVTTTGEISTPRDVHRDPAAPVNFFNKLEALPSPLVFTHLMVDDGDELTLGGAGFLAARHTAATGEGAIAVTRSNKVITLGFLPVGLVFQGPRDGDSDGKPDVEELYKNMLGYLCGY